MGTHPYLYRYGLSSVESALRLPALTRTSVVAGDVIRVEHGRDECPSGTQWSHHWLDGDEVVLSLARQGADFWLRFPGLADFLLMTDQRRIGVAPDAAADENTLEHLLVDQVLPRFLAHASELMAHASAVTLVDRHVLFLGPSGWGKSTLAALLQRHGHTVHSDDCVLLRFANGRCESLPTYPSLRLYSDSLDALFPAMPTTSPVASYSEKLRVPLPMPDSSSVPVDAIFVMGDPAEGGDIPRISAIGPAHACQALIAHSFRLDLDDREGNAAHFARCAAVIKAVPAYKLDYPRDYGQSKALVDAITLHVSQLPTLVRPAPTP